MRDAQQAAIDTLVSIAENENAEDDTRIRAARAILELLHVTNQGAQLPTPA